MMKILVDSGDLTASFSVVSRAPEQSCDGASVWLVTGKGRFKPVVSERYQDITKRDPGIHLLGRFLHVALIHGESQHTCKCSSHGPGREGAPASSPDFAIKL